MGPLLLGGSPEDLVCDKLLKALTVSAVAGAACLEHRARRGALRW